MHYIVVFSLNFNFVSCRFWLCNTNTIEYEWWGSALWQLQQLLVEFRFFFLVLYNLLTTRNKEYKSDFENHPPHVIIYFLFYHHFFKCCFWNFIFGIILFGKVYISSNTYWIVLLLKHRNNKHCSFPKKKLFCECFARSLECGVTNFVMYGSCFPFF